MIQIFAFNSDVQNALVQEGTNLANNQPRISKHLLKISKKPDSKRRQFAKHLAQSKLMTAASHVLQKTNTSTLVGVFNKWVEARNSRASHANICPEDLLIHSHPISVSLLVSNTVRNSLATLFCFQGLCK